jgi:hypothetical protein
MRTKPTTLVLVVTFLGFGACAVMWGIVTWALSNIRSEREDLDTLQSHMARMVTALDDYQIQGRDTVTAFLDNKKTERTDVHSVAELKQLVHRYKTMGATREHGVDVILRKLESQLETVEENRIRCRVWNKEHARLEAKFLVVRSRVRETIAQMRNAIITTEGRVRLARALQIRNFRAEKNKGMQKVAAEIIDGMAHGADISLAKTELADLALLTERLLAEEEFDNLVDLKDNEFKSTLDRLERSFDSLKIRFPSLFELVTALLEDFKLALFGLGYKVDAAEQTIMAGKDGLYGCCKARLALSQEREALKTDVILIFDALGSIRQKLVVQVEAHANETAAGAEQALGNAWRTMLIVGAISMIFFLLLSARIAKTLRMQIAAIEETNENLKKEIFERERIEKALRQREDELQAAKNNLEVRVEERTVDLQRANAHLEKEIQEKKRAEKQLRIRGKALSEALSTAKKAKKTAEEERDRSEKMLAEVTEANRRAEILISDASAREARMIDLKREVNNLLKQQGDSPKYMAPGQVDAFLKSGKPPAETSL